MDADAHAGRPLHVRPPIDRDAASVNVHRELAGGNPTGRVDGVHPDIHVAGDLGDPGARGGRAALADRAPAGPAALLPDELVGEGAGIAGHGQAQLALVAEQGRPAVGRLSGDAVEGEVLGLHLSFISSFFIQSQKIVVSRG